MVHTWTKPRHWRSGWWGSISSAMHRSNWRNQLQTSQKKSPYTGLPTILVLQRYYLHSKEAQTFACSFWKVISKPLECHNWKKCLDLGCWANHMAMVWFWMRAEHTGMFTSVIWASRWRLRLASNGHKHAELHDQTKLWGWAGLFDCMCGWYVVTCE